MQVQIQGETKDLPLQTITLQPEDSNNMYSFHCPNCGNAQQQVGGKVTKIYPFYEPYDQVPVVSKCRNCKRKFTFQTHDGYSSEKIKVILHPVEEMNYFYCWQGNSDKILDYSQGYIYSYVEKRIKTTPFFSPCVLATCKTVYYFADLV